MRVRVVAVLGLLCLALPVLAQEPEPPDRFGSRVGQDGAPPALRQARVPRRRAAVHSGVHLRVLRDYALAEGETSNEPIVVIGGDADIDGEARADVTIVGGSLRLGPSAVVDGRVTAVGARTDIAPGAQVRGPVERVSVAWPTVAIGLPAAGDWAGVQATLAALRLGLLLVVALGLTLVAPGWIRTIAGRPVAVSGMIGLTTEVAFVPVMAMVIIALVVSVVGIPLLGLIPFLVLIGLVVWTAGFAGVAARLGGVRHEEDRSRFTPAAGLLRGYAVIVSVTVAGHLLALGPAWLDTTAGVVQATGLLVEYTAWTVGLGAGLASLFVSRRAPSLPQPPAPA